jgi:beta-lactamase superfamily II metal-dependent hydrolase
MSQPSKFLALLKQGFGFAIYPEARLYREKGQESHQHLIFGDYISPPKNADGSLREWTEDDLKKDPNGEGTWWLYARSRKEEGWINLDDIQLDRILEVNFVDIGQGDGCHLVTPDDCHFIIDAGKHDNMYRFLRWRFNLGDDSKQLPTFYAVISHCDDDHWGGFVPLLSKLPPELKNKIRFKKLYHQGILQRSGSQLGEVVEVKGERYLTDFMETQQSIEDVLYTDGKKSEYEKLLIGALENFPKLKLETVYKKEKKKTMLYKEEKLQLEILAPLPENVNDKLSLRWFDTGGSGIGKTKNGHSIVLMAHIGRMKILLGGDLNSKSAEYLMEQYSGKGLRALKKKMAGADEKELVLLEKELSEIIHQCRVSFEAHIAKACHHGSHDIPDEFLRVVNPIATIISSGDQESHCHPRPETLGAIGKNSRGDRPLIYSTELSRSSPEFIDLKAKEKDDEIEAAPNSHKDQRRQRIVATYGMITLRTDGEKAILSQKLEKNRSSPDGIVKWQIDKLLWNDEKQEFVSPKK